MVWLRNKKINFITHPYPGPVVSNCGILWSYSLVFLGHSLIYRGSYMSAHVLSWGRDKMPGLPRILYLFRNKFNKFNNTGA